MHLVLGAQLLTGSSAFPRKITIHWIEDFQDGRLCAKYRRGKPETNDIDIVFTHPNIKSTKELCERLVERLRSAGLVTHACMSIA